MCTKSCPSSIFPASLEASKSAYNPIIAEPDPVITAPNAPVLKSSSLSRANSGLSANAALSSEMFK